MSEPTFVISKKHGCVYSYCFSTEFGNYLIHTPLNPDGTYSTKGDDWCEVELGEDQEIQNEIDRVWYEIRKSVTKD